jgi:hypothetical protein
MSPNSQPQSTSILLLGAGELGTSLLSSLTHLPNVHITLGIRSPAKYTSLASSKVDLAQIDLSSPSEHLTETFSHYDILISATGFGQDPSTVHKLAHEVLLAGSLRRSRGEGKLWFFPWQWGVDYDVTRDGEGLMPLFGAQKEVRDLLRSEADAANVKWTIVSTGIFMSFLFEPFWGVVDREKMIVRALGSWEHKVTVTDVRDIGRVLARIVAGHVESTNRVLYVTGDTVSYAELADLVARVSSKKVEKEAWTIPYLQEELRSDPENGIKKYRLVFAREGVWWNKEGTVNEQLGMKMLGVEEYANGLFGGSN